MEKISISNLCANPNINFTGTLSVQSLVTETKKTHTLDNDIDEIVHLQKERRAHKIKAYKRQLKICAEKMKEANRLRNDCVIFTVPTFVFNCPEYDADECLSYIDTELKKRKLDTKIEGLSIFISWLYINMH